MILGVRGEICTRVGGLGEGQIEIGVGAIVAGCLLSSFRDMAGHGGQPFQGVVGFLLFAILGAVNDRACSGE